MVVLNLLMQFWLLAMVSRTVLHRHTNLIDSLLHREEVPWYRMHEWWRPAPSGCRSSETLCYPDAEGITCAPPSIQVLKQWQLLDINGDGVWSRSEAERKDVGE